MVHHQSQLPPKVEPEGILIAVFPISNFIAFPKTVVPLHIFEQRYRQMLQDINETEDKTFVLTNLSKDKEGNDQPIEIGVFSQVISQEILPDGRSNILVRCLDRVNIIDYFRPYSNSDYAIGEIKPYFEITNTIDSAVWLKLFPELLSVFKKQFDVNTQIEIMRIARDEAPEMTIEEIVNTMCQYSIVTIDKKINLLKENTILGRAKLLQTYLNEKEKKEVY
jgi:Lon protease-like protein